jgi:predicted DNA-binding transcriptional regulator AlpA
MHLPETGFVRIREIVRPNGVLPIARSTWWAGVKSGRFPAPAHIGRLAVWRVEEIRALIDRIAEGDLP